ncbi:RIO1 family regulatory kinase/ATPase [Candidatus Bipolaricaulota bacterium]
MRDQRLGDIDPEEEKLRGVRSLEEEEQTVEEVLLSHLDPLIEDQLIEEVIRPIKAGKEAVVYCCRAHESLGGELIAAKIYRPVEQRSFKRDAVYQQGRERGSRPDARTLRALGKKTKRGRLHKFSAWIAHEMRTMTLLYQAGADVPEPIDRVGPVILMEYFGDTNAPAPVLVSVTLDSGEVSTIYKQILHNIEVFLVQHRVHADLSAYNMLYVDDRIVIIDFPQSVDPRYNDDAFDLLTRDLKNVNAFFADYDIEVVDPFYHTLDLWRKHVDPMR